MAVVISVARDIGLLDVSDENCPFDDFKRIYDLAYDMHLKGCATFRPNPVTGIVLSEARYLRVNSRGDVDLSQCISIVTLPRFQWRICHG